MIHLSTARSHGACASHLVAALLLILLAGCSRVSHWMTSRGAESQGRSPTGLWIRNSSLSTAIAVVGEQYALQPLVRNPDASVLKFRVAGKPSWAMFDATTGLLSGTPAPADIGTYANIIITVENGDSSASLGPLEIAVVPAGIGVATVSWMAPTRKSDGTALKNLAGYRVYFGTKPSALTHVQQVADAGATSTAISKLQPGTWYFAVTAYNKAGVESAPSGAVSKVIPP